MFPIALLTQILKSSADSLLKQLIDKAKNKNLLGLSKKEVNEHFTNLNKNQEQLKTEQLLDEQQKQKKEYDKEVAELNESMQANLEIQQEQEKQAAENRQNAIERLEEISDELNQHVYDSLAPYRDEFSQEMLVLLAKPETKTFFNNLAGKIKLDPDKAQDAILEHDKNRHIHIQTIIDNPNDNSSLNQLSKIILLLHNHPEMQEIKHALIHMQSNAEEFKDSLDETIAVTSKTLTDNGISILESANLHFQSYIGNIPKTIQEFEQTATQQLNGALDVVEKVEHTITSTLKSIVPENEKKSANEAFKNASKHKHEYPGPIPRKDNKPEPQQTVEAKYSGPKH